MELKLTIAFALITLLNAMSPGPSLALLAHSLSSEGVVQAGANIIGLTLGLMMHGTLLQLGLSVLIYDSDLIFRCVKLIGAVYLCWLGFKALARAWKNSRVVRSVETRTRGTTCLNGCRDGFLTCSLNPQTYLFYLAMIPQFVPGTTGAKPTLLILISISVIVSVSWYCVLVWLFDMFNNNFRNNGSARWVSAFSGISLIAIGSALTINAA